MYYLLQLLLATIAVYGVFNLKGDARLYVALACLTSMLVIGRLDKEKYEKKEARRSFLKSEIEKIARKDTTAIKEQDFFTINSLLWPKGELVLIDAVHFIFKDLGFVVSTGGRYSSVDRIVKIPDQQSSFGLEILMSEDEVDKNHPKIMRALQFEKEKKESEKVVIIASTHIRQSISGRERMSEISKELHEFLAGCQITLIPAYSLYQLWQRSTAKELDIFEVFRKIYSHPGGVYSAEKPFQTCPVSPGV